MFSIGIDIGGTKIAAGLVNQDGEILESYIEETSSANLEKINDDIVFLSEKLAKDKQIVGIGVATTGFISKDRDKILFGTNIEHKSYNLKKVLEERLPYKIVIENDANAAGWAEYKFGAGKGASSMLMITSGTGIGGANIIDNKLVRGNYGKGGEVGHMKIVPNGAWCSCGLSGCLEAYASGSALVRNATNLLKANPSKMQNILKHCPENKIIGPAITLAAQEGDETAKDLLAEIGYWIGYGAANLATINDPEIIVIGGGVCAAKDLILKHVKSSYYENLSSGAYTDTADIVLAQMQNDAGMIGSADLARV
ncbi:ROK family glucokinase [Actinomyces sp. zg-332]|uniref:ROK family glucokinase n=1 Tax=Actinomyces sp. zg-332 TaxID=2708340 RepID=UPI00141F8791|nr:ROK family glucokinase [Actinomyces sp. zg-332]QPK94639.1 ROK family glucokinase [Actinomyces sp. zg-332]